MKNKNLFVVLFSGISFKDVLARYGLLEDIPKLPFIPGFECSGEVIDIGPNVNNVEVKFKTKTFVMC